ncbi:MAG: hypothetical protein IJ160_01500 [Muribaculaceae bacterium]|nr:hypothetical protein [Muribaculaceae bacterium]
MKKNCWKAAMFILMLMCLNIHAQVNNCGAKHQIPPVPSPILERANIKTEWTGVKPNVVTYDNRVKKVLKHEESAPFQVEIVIQYDAETQQPDMLGVTNTNLQYILGGLPNTISSIPFLIEGGIYDFSATFKQMNAQSTWLHTLYVFHEQVCIDKDTTIILSADEAKNHIRIQTLTIDGEPVNTGKWHQEDDGTLTCVEEGNMEEVFSFNFIYCKDYGVIYGMDIFNPYYTFGVLLDNDDYNQPLGEMRSDYYVNDVSDRIIFNANRMSLDANLNCYTSNYEVQGVCRDTTLTNNPSDYKLYSDSFERGCIEGSETHSSLNFYVLKPGSAGQVHITINSIEPLAKGEKKNFYIGASPEISQYPFVPMVEAGRSIPSGQTPWGEKVFDNTLMTAPLINLDGKVVFANNGTALTHNGITFHLEQSDVLDAFGQDTRQIPLYPTHPAFTFSSDEKAGELGNNSPMLLTQFHHYNDHIEGTAYGIGRYGEKVYSYDNYKVCAKNNGNEFFLGEGRACLQYVDLTESLSGVIDIELVSDNYLVDEMPANNHCKIHYCVAFEDNQAPTLTNLQFRDNNGLVTDRFKDNNDGLLQFLAGDFNEDRTPNDCLYWNRQMPESVEVSYSPYGESNWNELNVEEVPEYFWPLLGWFYRGSLAGVTGEALKGWFDLKVKLTDAAGNWQEQVISPAFCIDDLAYTSVANVGSTNVHEVARYNLAGQRIDTNTSGIVIIKMSDGTARKTIQ